MNRFSGKAVVVTGAASGFGEAIARRFAAEGASVCLSDIDVERLERIAAELGRGDGTVECVPADVSQEDDVRKLIETAHTTFGALDVLVNNAGYSHRSQLQTRHSVHDRPGRRRHHQHRVDRRRRPAAGCHALQCDQGGGWQSPTTSQLP